MIKNGLEYKECRTCKKICLKPEITPAGECRDCVIERLEAQIEKMKCCGNCADYDGTDCAADHELDCRYFTENAEDDDFWRPVRGGTSS